MRPRHGHAQARHSHRLNITERSAHGIITDLNAAGYLVKQKDGRRNRYQIQAHLPMPEPPAGNAPSAKSWPSSRATTGPPSKRMAEPVGSGPGQAWAMIPRIAAGVSC